MPLTYELDLPQDVADGAPVIVLLHGRGSNRFDLLGLRDGLPSEAILVTPEAPFPGEPWGYGPGSAWYRYLGTDRPDPDTFRESLDAVEELLGLLPGALPIQPGPIALGGFSQGGTTSIGYALTHPGTVPCVVNFSGFLPSHPDVQATPETVAGTRFFWGHGQQDPAIPFAMAKKGRGLLEEAGAHLTVRDDPIGHWISPAELAVASRWLRDCFAEAT